METPPASANAPTRFTGLRPPPREVLARIRICELFGSASSMGALLYLVISLHTLFSCLAKYGPGELLGLRYLGPLSQARGTMNVCMEDVRSYATALNRQGRRIRYLNQFSFSEAGKVYWGDSYAWGDCLDAGTPVDVEFPRGDPEHARIVGMQSRGGGSWVILLLFLFPAWALWLAVRALRTGLKAIRVLAKGVPASGRLLSVRRVLNRYGRYWEMVYGFSDARGIEQTTRTTSYEWRERLAVTPEAASLLYDPEKPEEAIVLEARPEPLLVDAAGELRAGGWHRAVFALIAPLLVILDLLYWLLRPWL